MVATTLISSSVLFWDVMLVLMVWREASIVERSTFSDTGAGLLTAVLIFPKSVV